MNTTRIAWAIAGAALLGMTTVAIAADKPDWGKREYDSNCAVCHGKLGKGDGPYAGMVDTRGGADLTQLAKKNGGVFPILKVTRDHRRPLPGEGPRAARHADLGHRLPASTPRTSMATAESPFDAEAMVTYRIYALAEYLVPAAGEVGQPAFSRPRPRRAGRRRRGPRRA